MKKDTYSEMTMSELKEVYALCYQKTMTAVIDKMKADYFSKKVWITEGELKTAMAQRVEKQSNHIAVVASFQMLLNLSMIIQKDDKVRLATQEDWNTRDYLILESRKGESISDN